jgi:hypothetical protein
MSQPNTHPGKDTVNVKIDGVEKTIHRGSHSVADLKTLLGVDPVQDLDQEIDGVLTELKNDARVTIKGGELFFSHARTGGSS